LKRRHPYRFPLFLLVLLGALLVGQAANAQRINDFERILKTEKQKKRPKKKKQKDPDQSPRDRVWELSQKPVQHDPKPGSYRSDKHESIQHREVPAIAGREARHLMQVRRRKIGKAKGTDSQGGLSVKRKEIEEPGKVYDPKEREKSAAKNRSRRGTDSQGDLTVKRKNIDQPGVVYNDKDRQKGAKRQKLPGTQHDGHQTVRASERVAPGTHHSERNEKAGQRSSSYSAARHAGNTTVKTKYVREPGTHWSERKASFARQYSSTPATSHEGNVRTMTQRQKKVYYGDLSEKMNQYRGDIVLRKREADMHPSVVARGASSLRSADQRAKARKRSNTINRIFTSKQDPKSAKAKPMKPRYDKGESSIWYD
jgi:hypothetical protein